MKVLTPQISWHNRLPILALDIAPPNPEDPNGKLYRVATGGNDCKLYIWLINPESNSISIRAGIRLHQASIGAVRFSADHVLASGDDNGFIYLWKRRVDTNMDTQEFNPFLNDDEFRDEENWQRHRVLRGHRGDISDLAWSLDGRYLLSGAVDNSVYLWDATKGTRMWYTDEIKGFVQGVTIDPHLKYLVALSSDRTLKTFGFSDGRLLSQARQMSINDYKAYFCDDSVQTFCRRLQCSPDGQFLIVPTARMAKKERPSDNQQDQENPINVLLVFKRGSFNKPYLYYEIGEEVALCVRFCPIAYELYQPSDDNFWKMPYRFLFAVATTKSILIYDSQQKSPIIYVSDIHLARLTDLSWSHDGRMLLISSYDGFVTQVLFEKNELGEVYEGPLVDPQEKDGGLKKGQEPAEPKGMPESSKITRFLIKKSRDES